MDVNYVLNLPAERLYDDFIEPVLSNPLGFNEIVTDLEASKKYTDDLIFRIHVQTAKQFITVSLQKLKEVQEVADDIIMRASVAGLPEILNLNYHILAISYKLMGHYGQALECFFKVLKGEKLLPIKRLSSIVNFYIGEIYEMHDDKETALKYLNTAFEILEATKDREPRYDTKKLSYTYAIVQLLYREHKYEEMNKLVEGIKQYSTDTSPMGFYTYHISMLLYHLSKKEFEEAKKVFYELLDSYGDNTDYKSQQILIYLSLLDRFELDPSFYEKELLFYKNAPKSNFPVLNYNMNKYLFDYYNKMGDKDVANEHLHLSFLSLEEEMKDLRSRNLNSFKIVEKNSMIEEDISYEREKNHELKLITDEALRNKELAETALHRLSLVNELGKQLTHSLNMDGIINTIYEKLMEKLPVQGFLIMIKNSEAHQLESVIFYEHGKKQDKLIIDQNDETSVFMEAFNKKNYIKIDDFFEDKRFDTQQARYEEDLFRSVLFMPLSVDNEVLGVCSLQHSKPHMYTDEHITFLEELLPYLSIALNNAIKSEALKKEIRQRERAQNKLQEVNRKLEILSSLDGLTKISNRRDFENRILDLMETSRKENLPISLFMFDIDFFKLYNDNYGHLEGDEALKATAEIISKNIEKKGGISARFGGEEFVAACLKLSEKECMELGNTIREGVLGLKLENIKAPLGILSISTGVAYADTVGDLKKSTIMRWADVSLYNAKRTGKNKVVLKHLLPDEEAPEGLD